MVRGSGAGARGARGLTPRGRALLVAGLLLGAAGLWWGQQALLRGAVLLLVLPLVSLALAAATGTRTRVRRTTTPARAVVGQTCRVRLDITNAGRLGAPVLLAQDHLPAGWSSAPRFAVDPLRPGGRAAVAYSATPPRRGHHRLGPLQVLVTDPLGLVELPSRSGGQDDVLVLPAVEPVPGAAALLASHADGDAGGGGSGEQGMGTREYRAGDDQRRIHWRSTARRGQLMVRQDEQPRQRRGCVVLDRREGAYAGADRFELAVSAAASLALSLHDAGAVVRLEAGGGRVEGAEVLGREGLLEVLAVVEASEDAGLLPAAAGPGASAGSAGSALAGGWGAGRSGGRSDGPVAVVAGRLSRADAELLAGASAGAGARQRAGELAVLVEPAAPGAVQVLLDAGWSVHDLSEGEPLAEVWLRARGAAVAR